MIIRLVISVVFLATINSAATSTAEETLSHTTKDICLCITEVHSIFLLLKKIILKSFTDLCDDFVGYAVGIFVFKLQHSNEEV